MSNEKTPSLSAVSIEFQVITDLIDLERLQRIQDSFAEANSVASSLTDVEGLPITRLSNHSKVCNRIRATEKGRKNCIFSGKELGRKAGDKRHSIHQQCYSIGFTDAVAPIIINGKHIANWMIGQYHVGKVDEARVRDYALEIGADPVEMVQEFAKMPKLTLEDFEKKLSFLHLMANELSLLGYQNLVQRQQTAELNRSKEELQKYKSQLELLVEKRTAALEQSNQQLTEEITQKTKMQKQQNRLITAIESAAESIVITTPAGKIFYVNPAFEQLTGYSRREMLGKTPRILKSGIHGEQFYNNLWQTITAGEVWVGRFTNKKKDGTFYQDDSTISPVKDDQGKILSFVAVKKDITKELELEKQLHQAQKLESIGILAAGMAHEINTPIQYVLGNTQFLKEVLGNLAEMQSSYENLVKAVSESGAFAEQVATISRLAEQLDFDYLKNEANEAIDQALEGINRISTIVSAMKEFAQPGSADKQPVNLNEIIKNTVDVSTSLWQNLAEMKLDLDENLPFVPLLAGGFKQILLDMITNACHALAEKHHSAPQKKGQISITTRALAHHVEVRLADTGTGIPSAIIDKVFDPFFTTKHVGEGTGQGLAVAYGLIVDKHGGTIRVSSVEGKGSTFTITLPLD